MSPGAGVRVAGLAVELEGVGAGVDGPALGEEGGPRADCTGAGVLVVDIA